MQLEDGQAVQLEDGTTAYIHTPKGNMINHCMRELLQCAMRICLFALMALKCLSFPVSKSGTNWTLYVKLLILCADTYDQSGLQEVQLEDGSTAYIQHTVHMPPSNTILAIQADGTIADLQAEATALDPDTISVLEQYTTKVNTL